MTPGELRDLIAEILDVPRTRVERVQTGIREAGMITKKGRGRSSAEMTFRDAGILLVGTVVTLPLTELVAALRQIELAPFKGVGAYDYTAPNETRPPFDDPLIQQQSELVRAHLVQSPKPFDVLAHILKLSSEGSLFLKGDHLPFHPIPSTRTCTMLILGDAHLQRPTILFDYQIGPLALPLSRFLISFGPGRDHRNWFGEGGRHGGVHERRRTVFGMWGIGIDVLDRLANAMRGASPGY